MSPLWWLLPLCLTFAAIGWAILWPYACNNWWGWTILLIRLFIALTLSLGVWAITAITHWGVV